jgi:hypothetical protein
MITSRTELSEFCKAVRTAITSTGNTIKLASVRERVAQSFSYNSVNDLLANLPISLTNDFWNELPKAFQREHDIDFTTPAWEILFPEHFPLNTAECEVIWHKLCQSIEITEDEAEFINGSEIRPDGTGGWYFKHGIPYIAYDIENFKAEEDPIIEIQGDEYTLFELHLQCINTETPECCWSTYNTKYKDINHTSLSDFADELGIDAQDLPEAALRIETAYPISGFDSDLLEDNELFYEESTIELVEQLQTQGIAFVGEIYGHEESLYELGFVQIFFIAEANEAPAHPTPFVFGNYLVSIAKKSRTKISSTLFNIDKKTIIEDDNPNDDEMLEPEFHLRQRRIHHLTRHITGEISDSVLSVEQMINACVNNKEFPLFNFVEGQLDEFEEIDLELNINYVDDVFEITTMPLTNIIPAGHKNAEGLVGAISTLMRGIKKAGACVKVNANQGEIFSDNINTEIVLSVVHQYGVKLSNVQSVFGDYKGYLKPNNVANWLKSIGVVQLNANAFNSGYTGDWIYLSIAGFDQQGRRICVLGITFYAVPECDSWYKWLDSFQNKFGSKIHINETYEYTWHFEDNPRSDNNPPYSIPEAPLSYKPKLGLAWFAFANGKLNGNVPLVLPKRINELLFTDRDLSKLPPFRITTLIAVPDGQNAFEFFNGAMEYAGEVALEDDKSWERFMRKIFEYIIDKMTPISQMHSFLLIEGGNSALQNVVIPSLPTNLQEEWENVLMGVESEKSRFNTVYNEVDLKEISKILNINGVEGVNFAISGKPT